MTAQFSIRQSACSFIFGLALFSVSTNAIFAQSSNMQPSARTATAQASAPVDDAARKQVVYGLWSKYHRCGIDAFKKGDYDAALNMLGKAVEEAELLKLSRPEMAETFDALAEVYKLTGDKQDSLQAGLKAIAIRGNSSGLQGQEKVEALIKAAELYEEAGDLQKAKVNYDEAVKVAGANAESIAVAKEGLAKIAIGNKDFAVAQKYISELISLDGGASTDTAAKHQEFLAVINWQTGNVVESAKCMEKAFAIRSAIANEDAGVLMACTRNYVRAEMALGKLEGLNVQVAKLLQYDRKNLAPDAPDYLCDLQSLAELKFASGETNAAKVLLDEIAKSDLISKNKDAIARADYLSLLGKVAVANKQLHEGKSLAEQALAIRQGLSQSELLLLSDKETIANVDFAQGQVAEAQKNLQDIIKVRSECLGKDDPGVLRANALMKLIAEKTPATAISVKPAAAN